MSKYNSIIVHKGNTVDAVAEILLLSGVKAVDFVTVSIGKGL